MFWILFIIIGVPVTFALLIFCAIIQGILFGSTVDPDDNGILRSKQDREIYRQKKLRKYNLTDS